MAEKLGLTQAAISKVLNGKSDRSFQRLLVLLSKEYGMDFDTKLALNQNEDIETIKAELQEIKATLQKRLEELKEMIGRLEK